MKLLPGSRDHLVVSAALSILRGPDEWPFSVKHLNTLSNVEGRMLCGRLIGQGTLPIVARAAEMCDLKITGPISERFYIVGRVAKSISALLRKDLLAFAQAAAGAGISFMLVGGLDLETNVWPNLPALGTGIELLVGTDHIRWIPELLARAGYVQGNLNRPGARIDVTEWEELPNPASANYEPQTFRRIVRVPELDEYSEWLRANYPRPEILVIGTRVYVAISVDAKRRLLPDSDSQRFLEESRQIDIDGHRMLALSSTDMIYSLGARFYQEVMHGVGELWSGYLDLVATLNVQSRTILWDRIVEAAAANDLQPGLYYVLRHARELLGRRIVPEMALKALRHNAGGASRLRDWGSFMPRLLEGGVHVQQLDVEL